MMLRFEGYRNSIELLSIHMILSIFSGHSRPCLLAFNYDQVIHKHGFSIDSKFTVSKKKFVI